MQVVMVVGTPHVERIRCALGADQAEMGEKFLHLAEIGGLHAREGEIGDLDCRHRFLRNLVKGTLAPARGIEKKVNRDEAGL
jgi:hypothetical protein